MGFSSGNPAADLPGDDGSVYDEAAESETATSDGSCRSEDEPADM